MIINLLNQFGHPVRIEIWFTQTEIVVINSRDRAILGAFDREAFADWLTEREGELSAGDVTWMGIPNGVALAVEDTAPMWPLSDEALYLLRTNLLSGAIITPVV